MWNFSQILHRFFIQSPNRVAIHLLQKNQADISISYNDLFTGAAVYAQEFDHLGIKSGEAVVLILHHSVELVNAFYGAVLHGSIPSIMPILTEKLFPERYYSELAEVIKNTRPATVVTSKEFEPELRSLLPSDSLVKMIVLTGRENDFVKVGIDDLGGFKRRPDNIALIQHSSGTTGLQKGVALSHRAVMNQLDSYSQAIGLKDTDVIVSWLPLYHDMGLIACFIMPVLTGATLILMSPFDWIRAPHKLMHAVSDYGGTMTWLPNFAYNFCAHKIRDHHLEGVDLSTWRAVINSSEPVRWHSHKNFFKRFRHYGLRQEALQTCYAMAENVFAVTQSNNGQAPLLDKIDCKAFWKKHMARPAEPNCPSLMMLSSGQPIKNVHVRILNDQGQDIPQRCIGEVALKSDCMLNEYYNRPDATAQAFRDGWYLTGDYGYLVGEELFICGRKKDLINVGGKNVYPQDVEELVMGVSGVHPGRVAAFGVFNEKIGTEEVVVVAELENGRPVKKDFLAETIRRNVACGSAVALRDVYLVNSSWLIKTSSGKVARRANRDKYLLEVGMEPSILL